MSLSANARANALFAAVQQANPKVDDMSDQERQTLLGNLRAIFGSGDLTYLLANTVVLPATMQAPPGASVVTAGGPTSQSGATTSAVAITGAGRIS